MALSSGDEGTGEKAAFDSASGAVNSGEIGIDSKTLGRVEIYGCNS